MDEWIKDYSDVSSNPELFVDGRPVSDFEISTEKVIVFPRAESIDKKITLIKKYNDAWYTQQYVGMVQIEDDSDEEKKYKWIFFKSRFDNESNNFTKYVLSKALNMKLFMFDDMERQTEQGAFMDLLLAVVLIQQIEKAYRKGIYKQYCTFEGNDSKVRGKIDIARHIRLNPLFNGKIAYSYREYTINNNTNRLILTAYTLMEKKYKGIMTQLVKNKTNVSVFIKNLKNVMQPFTRREIPRGMFHKEKKVTNSLYKDWEAVRKTSVMILRHFGINIDESADLQTKGILIDMNKIWECYIESILENKNLESQKEIEILFEKDVKRTSIKPDFLIETNGLTSLILDAKYKNKWEKVASGEKIEWPREETFQVLSYMYILECNKGGIVCPMRVKSGKSVESKIEYDITKEKDKGKFAVIPIGISQETDVSEFKKQMEENERNFREAVNAYMND